MGLLPSVVVPAVTPLPKSAVTATVPILQRGKLRTGLKTQSSIALVLKDFLPVVVSDGHTD